MYVGYKAHYMKKVHYPKNLAVPKHTVLQKREQRKMQRKLKIAKPQKRKPKAIPNTFEIKLKIPKNRRNYYEHKSDDSDLCLFRITKNALEHETVKIIIKKQQSTYIDWFWNLLRTNCVMRDLLIEVFPNTKEQSESVAALLQYRKHSQTAAAHKTGVIVVADGTTPRTGLLFALEEARWVLSVDPLMHSRWVESSSGLPSNLRAFNCKIEDANLEILDWENIENLVIVAVHAHVAFECYLHTLISIKKLNVTIIAIPCCIPLHISEPECLNFKLQLVHNDQDYAILSPCRNVFVWQNKQIVLIEKTNLMHGLH